MSEKNVISICPNCGHDRGKPAQAKYKCKQCRTYIRVKKTQFNKIKRPMTVAQCNEIEKVDYEKHRKNVVTRHNQIWCEGLKEKIIGLFKANRLPDLNYVQVIYYGSDGRIACDSCKEIVGIYIKISDFPEANVLPNINCQKSPNDYLCALTYEEVFDDELPPLYRKPPVKQITNQPKPIEKKRRRTLVDVIAHWWGNKH